MSSAVNLNYLSVGIVPLLLTVFVVPTYGAPSSKVDPATKALVAAQIEKLKNKDSAARSSAVSVLGLIGPVTKNVVPALIGALKDDVRHVRRLAADALGRIGLAAKDAVPALTVALKDEDWRVRSSAVWA